MRIHIDQIKDKGLSLEFTEKPEVFPVLADMIRKEECEFLAPIHIRLRAMLIGQMVVVEGNIKTSVRLSCGRCLKQFDAPLETEFALTYTQELPGVSDESDQEEIELNAEQIGLIYFRGEQINLQQGIQEQVVMTLPPRPLCAKVCKGLCPKCGADLNKGDCICDRNPVSSKFAALKDLKLSKK